MTRWETKKRRKIENIDNVLHPIAAEILALRGIDNREKIESFLNPNYERDLHDPFAFSDMEKCVTRIRTAVLQKEKVAIFGDYDADGITATVILQEALEDAGITPAIYIPDKKTEGYGLNINAVEDFFRIGVKLIITVDCGITSFDEIERAKKLGMDVIVVDHHHVPEKMPEAFAIINPQLAKSNYPFAMLAGVGVVFKLVQAIYLIMLPEKKEQPKWMLDLVAVGTVADCVPLIDENRVLVKFGLLVLGKTRRVGLQELFAVGRILIDENNLPDTRKISFQIAPRLNAAGRMDHASEAYNLLVENNRIKARELALEIESKNQRRQKETDEVFLEVKNMAEKEFCQKKLILASAKHYPIGTAGLVAGRITDYFGKVTGVFQREEKISRGSFRSIPEINIIKLLEKCRSLLLKCGGHSQAAGASLANENFDKFYNLLNILIEKELTGKICGPKIEIDAIVTAADIDFELVEALEKFAPFGEGNEEPVFLMKNLRISDLQIVGLAGKHIKLTLIPVDRSPKIFNAIGFNLNEKFSHLKKDDVIDILFNLQLDRWNGNKKIQLKLIDLKRIEENKNNHLAQHKTT